MSADGEQGGVKTLIDALAERDRKADLCPGEALDFNKPCPRCGASASEGCRVTALADAAFVHAARTALAKHPTSPEDAA